jgi:signal transduction histidine kinase
VDDRLATVLRLRVENDAAARIQFHQLLDLLGTLPSEARGGLVDTAYARIAELSRRIPVESRMAMLAEPALRLRSPRLVAALAQGEPRVAQAAVRGASLAEEQWLDLIPALPPAARAAVRARGDSGSAADALLTRLGVHDRGLPPVAATTPEPAAPTAPAEPTRDEGIGAILRRIEAFRRAREASPATPLPDAPQLPLGEVARSPAPPLLAFDFETDAEGRITAGDTAVMPMVQGLSLAGFAALAPALRARQPLSATILLGGAAALAGDWRIDAVPRFDPLGGHYLGHIGRCRRAAAPAAPQPIGEPQGDRLRQLLHELRTPINAIQGYAEIIQQQLFGPAPHAYRALAANIAGDAAAMLAGFDELDRLAQLDEGRLQPEEGSTDLAAVIADFVARLDPRGERLRLGGARTPLPVAVAAAELERLAGHLLGALDASQEPLALHLGLDGAQAVLTVTLPAALADLSDEDLFHAAASLGPPTAVGLFGTGFALRLAQAEARACGGRLDRRGQSLNLWLPYLTSSAADHSHGGEGGCKQAGSPVA